MRTKSSILSLVTQATLVVQLVMAGLMMASLGSWTVIFGKLFGLKRVRNRNDEFEREFWSGRSLTELSQAAGSKPHSAALERIFASGMREYQKLRVAQLQHQLVFDALLRGESARVEMLMREHAYIGLRYGPLLGAAGLAGLRP